jgi:hypothetical protein
MLERCLEGMKNLVQRDRLLLDRKRKTAPLSYMSEGKYRHQFSREITSPFGRKSVGATKGLTFGFPHVYTSDLKLKGFFKVSKWVEKDRT